MNINEGKERNALAELAERLKLDVDELNGKHRDHLGIYQCVTDDVCKAQRIIAELAKVETLYEKMNAKASNGNIVEAKELAHELHIAKGSMFAKCRAIAEEGAKQ